MVKVLRVGDKEIIAAVKNNDGYCPCAAVKNADTKCMCKEFREQSEGLCHCGLYLKIIDNN